MKTKLHLLIACLLGVPLMLAYGQATSTTATAPAAPPPPPELSPTEQTIKDIRNPVDWFTWGADMRIREE